MKIVFDSYREERVYHGGSAVTNALITCGCWWIGVAHGGATLWWMWLLGTYILLVGVGHSQKFIRAKEETYAVSEQGKSGKPPDE